MQLSNPGTVHTPRAPSRGIRGAEAGRPDAKLSVPAGMNTSGSIATRPSSTARPDFTAMTPREFDAASKAIYERGEIDFDTRLTMQMNAQFAANEYMQVGLPADGSVDFVRHFRNRIAFEESVGRQSDPRSPIGSYRTVLGLISGRMPDVLA